jgi:hypothetical protein
MSHKRYTIASPTNLRLTVKQEGGE